MLTWNKRRRIGQFGLPDSENLEAELPGWGTVRIHPRTRAPGLFLTCDSLGVEMHPLGSLAPEDAVKPAEAELERMLKQYIAWCEEGLAALHNGGHK